jgi:hypothetical protein
MAAFPRHKQEDGLQNELRRELTGLSTIFERNSASFVPDNGLLEDFPQPCSFLLLEAD